MWTQTRLLLQEQSDLGPHCLSMRLQIVKWTTKNIHFVIMRFKAAYSVTMNIFQKKKYFLFKSFAKVE